MTDGVITYGVIPLALAVGSVKVFQRREGRWET
nr:MAG TPA: hypothetical protein [Caudoviricetes sp.]